MAEAIALGVGLAGFFISAASALVKLFKPFRAAEFNKALKGVDDLIEKLTLDREKDEIKVSTIVAELKEYQKALKEMRNSLESLAKETIDTSDFLINVLRKDSVKPEDHKYAADRMIALVDTSLDRLEHFKQKYRLMNKDMSKLIADLTVLKKKGKYDYNFNAAKWGARKKMYTGNNLFLAPFCFMSFEGTLRSKQAEVEMSDQKMKNEIDSVMKESEETENYIEKEIDLIRDWSRQLNLMRPDFNSLEKLDASLAASKDNVLEMLEKLKNACNEYLNSPEIS